MGKSKLLGKLTEPPPNLEHERARKRLELANAELRRSNAAYLLELERLEREKSVLLALDDRQASRAWARPAKVEKGEAAAILLISDIHLEEVVKRSKVNGLNSYGPDIAAASVREVFSRFVLLLERYRLLAKIENCVIWLGGDIISGTIHEELLENNALSPIMACLRAEEVLEQGIRYVAQHAKMSSIAIVGSAGNHDRTTHKTRACTKNDNSYSTLIYQHLRKLTRDLENVRWQLDDGELSYLEILGHTVRFTHGDCVKYGGGIGGISIPLNKAITRWNAARKADLTCLGHFHQHSWSRALGYVVNGSVIGTTPYSLKFGHEPPCQAMVIIDRKRGVTDVTPVFAR